MDNIVQWGLAAVGAAVGAAAGSMAPAIAAGSAAGAALGAVAVQMATAPTTEESDEEMLGQDIPHIEAEPSPDETLTLGRSPAEEDEDRDIEETAPKRQRTAADPELEAAPKASIEEAASSAPDAAASAASAPWHSG